MTRIFPTLFPSVSSTGQGEAVSASRSSPQVRSVHLPRSNFQACPTLAIGQLQAEADVHRCLIQVNLQDPHQAPAIVIRSCFDGIRQAAPALAQEWSSGHTRMDEMLHQMAEIVSDGFFRVEMDEPDLTTQCHHARQQRHQRQASR